MNRSMPRLGFVLTFAVSCFTYLCAVPGAPAAPSVMAPPTPPPTLPLPERALDEGALSEGGRKPGRRARSGFRRDRGATYARHGGGSGSTAIDACAGCGACRPAVVVADGIVPLTSGALTLVDNTEDWPWSAHAKLIVTWPSGDTGSCSGTLIDPAFVIAAAHCVYTFTGTNCTGGRYV